MSELNIHRVTDVKVTKSQHKTFMCVTVTTTSVDYKGEIKVDEQRFFSRDKKLNFKVAKITKVE